MVVAIVGMAWLLIALGPQMVARHVVSTYLAGLNIDTSGVETLRLRPLRGYFSFGPVTFRGAHSEKGEVGRIGLKVDVRRLLRRQALVESIVIEGVRFEVRQAADGAISLNGIPLSEILADHGAGRSLPQPAPPARPVSPRSLQDELGWGAGLDSLQILDSRVAFVDARGGEAVMVVHELDLGGFRTWTPEKPGHYRLDSTLNDMAISAEGIAKPFADKIELETGAAVSGIEITKIERFLGPLGFTSRAGQIDLAVSDASFILFTRGRLEAKLAATGTLSGVDLAHPLFGRGRLAAGTLRLDNVAGSYNESGESDVSGDLGVDLQASEMRFDNGTRVGFSHVAFALPGTSVRMAPDQQPALRVAPALDVAQLTLGGPQIRGTVGHAAVRLSAFSIAGTEPGSPFRATGTVGLDRIALVVPDVEPVAINAERAQLDLAESHLAFPPGRGPRVEGGIGLDTRQLQVSLQRAGPGGRPQPPPSRMQAARFAVSVPRLTLDDGLGTDLAVSATGPRVSLEDARFTGPDVQGSVARSEFRLARVDVAAREPGTPLVATGTAAIDRLDLRLPGVEPMAVSLDQARLELAETQFAWAGGAPRVNGGLSLDAAALFVSIQEQARRGGPLPPPTEIGAATLALRMPNVALSQQAQVRADGPQVTVDALRLGGPDIQGTVGKAVIRLTRSDVAATEPGVPLIATGSVQAERLDLLVPDLEPIGIVAATVDADLNPMRFAFSAGRTLIEGAAAVDAQQLLITIQPQANGGGPAPTPVRIAADRFAGDVPTLAVDDSRATGTKVTVATPGLKLLRFRLDSPAELGPPLQLAAPALSLRAVDVNVIDAETLDVSGRGTVAADELSLVLPTSDSPAAVGRHAAVGDRAAAGARSGGGVATAAGQIRGLALALQRFSYREAGDRSGFGFAGRIDVRSLHGRSTDAGGEQAADVVALSGLKLDVADLDVESGGSRPAWRAALDLDLRSATASLRAPLPLSAEVEALALHRLAAASATQAYSLDALTIGRFDAAVTRERAAAAPADTPSRQRQPAPADLSWPPAGLPAIRIGRIWLGQGGRLSFLDRAVVPSVAAALEVETLNVENIDTGDPGARSHLQLKARLNDSPISVGGWAEAFHPNPSLSLRAQLNNLRLAPFSPYFGPATGIDVVGGEFSIGAAATVTAGDLDGRVRVRLEGVRMADRPPTIRPVGEPISTLIRLIEDSDGSIEVTMPVSGTVAAPQFGYWGAAWALLPRVLRAFVLAPGTFVSATWSLLAATGEDDGEDSGGDAVAVR